MPEIKVTIVICVCYRDYWLQKCLESILQLDYPHYDVIVVVDCPADEIFKILELYHSKIPNLKVLVHETRKGLSTARNSGIKESSGDIVAFIDDDVIVKKDWLTKLVKAYTEDSIGGAGGPVYKMDSKELQHGKMKINKFGKAHSFGKGLNKNEFLILQGGNMSFKREILIKVGSFDPYFTYMHDETDLCIRVTKSGYRLVYVPDAVVWHAQAPGPTRTGNFYHSSKNRIYFATKNFGTWDNIIKLMLYDTAYLIANYEYFMFLFLSRRIGLKEMLKIYKDMIIGRIDGYKDGFSFKTKNKE